MTYRSRTSIGELINLPVDIQHEMFRFHLIEQKEEERRRKEDEEKRKNDKTQSSSIPYIPRVVGEEIEDTLLEGG